MSLLNKINKYKREYDIAVAELDEDYQDRQQKAVLDTFDKTSEQLAKRVQVQEGSSAKQIKANLRKLKTQYEDTPVDLKELLEAPLKEYKTLVERLREKGAR